jgi:hypothetical protein
MDTRLDLDRLQAVHGRTPIGSHGVAAIHAWCLATAWYLRRHHIARPSSSRGSFSPAGKPYFYSQDWALDADDVVAFLAHLLREVPGPPVMIRDGAPIHRSQRSPPMPQS